MLSAAYTIRMARAESLKLNSTDNTDNNSTSTDELSPNNHNTSQNNLNTQHNQSLVQRPPRDRLFYSSSYCPVEPPLCPIVFVVLFVVAVVMLVLIIICTRRA